MDKQELENIGITWTYNPKSSYKYKVYKDGVIVSQMRFLDYRFGGTIEENITKMIEFGYIK